MANFDENVSCEEEFNLPEDFDHLECDCDEEYIPEDDYDD